MDNPASFQYTYSANEKKSTGSLPSDKESQKLHHRSNRAYLISILFGTVCLLVFGTGLSLVLAFESFVLGILIGLLGLIGMMLTPRLWFRLYQADRKSRVPAEPDSQSVASNL